MSKLNPVATNPVLTKDLATLIIWFVGRYGFHLDIETATTIAGVFFAGGSFFVRQLVKPTAKLQAEQAAEDAKPTDTAALRQLVDQVLASAREHQNAKQPVTWAPAPAVPGPGSTSGAAPEATGAPVEPAG